MMFTGTYTAIVTPFKSGKIDEPALERLIKSQIKGGVDGIVPVGTTGESAKVDYEEHIRPNALSVRLVTGKAVRCAQRKYPRQPGLTDQRAGR